MQGNIQGAMVYTKIIYFWKSTETGEWGKSLLIGQGTKLGPLHSKQHSAYSRQVVVI